MRAKVTPRWISRRAIHAAGLLLTLASLGFVAWGLLADDLLAEPAWRGSDLWERVAAGAAAYALLLGLLASGWLLVLRSASAAPLSWRQGFAIYAVTQIYKYLPLNVLHLVGRHARLRQRGIAHSAALWAAGAEMALLLIAAAMTALASGSAALLGRDDEAWGLAFGLAAALLAMPLLIRAGRPLLRRVEAARPAVEQLAQPGIAVAVLQALVLALLFFAGAGLILAVIAGTDAPSDLPALLGLWALAWGVGFVTPGAAAGVGVREMLLIAGLTALGADKPVLVACAMRLVTTGGDALFAALGHAAGRMDALSMRAPNPR